VKRRLKRLASGTDALQSWPPACPCMSLGARRLHSVKRHRVDGVGVRRDGRPPIGMASDTDALQISSLFLFAAGVYQNDDLAHQIAQTRFGVR